LKEGATLDEEKRCPKCQAKMTFLRKTKTIDSYRVEWVFEYYRCENCGGWTYAPENDKFRPTKALKVPSSRLRRRTSRRGGIGFSR